MHADAVTHAASVFPSHPADFGSRADLADADVEFGGVVGVGVVLGGGDGFDGLGEGVELDAVVGEGVVDGAQEAAEAVVVLHDEDVVFAAPGAVEEVAEGGDGAFGVAQVDIAGATMAGDLEGASGFDPVLGLGEGATGEHLVGEGGFVVAGLFFGGDGSEDGESHRFFLKPIFLPQFCNFVIRASM